VTVVLMGAGETWVMKKQVGVTNKEESRKLVEKVGRGSCSSLLLWDRGEDIWVPVYSCPWHQDF